MKNNWKKTSLGSVMEIIGGGTPKTSNAEYWNGEIPWLSVVDFNNDNRWVSNTEKTITEEGLKNSSTKLLDAGDIIISARGTVGAIAQLKKAMAFSQSCYGLRAIEGKTEDDFLFFLVKYNLDQIKKRVHGAVFDTITKQTFDEIEIFLPPLKTQRAIAGVLSSFDDKIELLREENITLENIAQTIFKEWFVKDENNITVGWTKRKLGNFFDVKTGKRNANHAKINGRYPFFTCSQDRYMCDEYSFDCSAILLAGNCDFNVKWYEGKFDAYQRTYVLTPHNAKYLGFLYFLMKYFLDDITSGHRGSVMSFITKGMIEDFEFNCPPDTELDNKTEIFYTIIKKMDFNDLQIETLSKVRNTLLPNLMGDKLKVD